MTKADIVEALNDKVGFSKNEASDLVELVFDTVKSTLVQSSKIKISGFGNFIVRNKRTRTGRNPQTGQSIEISARRVLTFRPSQILRSEVNASLEGKPIQVDSVGHGGDDGDDEGID
ncbi:MAG: integration host factor subunit alpha [Bdellovibrio sp.]|nr:integration host factor subunit alpha [Bdellovibrio sp.]